MELPASHERILDAPGSYGCFPEPGEADVKACQ